MPLNLNTPQTTSTTANSIRIVDVAIRPEADLVEITYGRFDSNGRPIDRLMVSCDLATAASNLGAGGLKAKMYNLLQFLLGATGTVS